MPEKLASDVFDMLPEEIQEEAMTALQSHNRITITQKHLRNSMGEVWGWTFWVNRGGTCRDEAKAPCWECLSDRPIEITRVGENQLVLRWVDQS